MTILGSSQTAPKGRSHYHPYPTRIYLLNQNSEHEHDCNNDEDDENQDDSINKQQEENDDSGEQQEQQHQLQDNKEQQVPEDQIEEPTSIISNNSTTNTSNTANNFTSDFENNEEDDEDDFIVMNDLDWRIAKLKLEEENRRRFLRSGPRYLPYQECRKWVIAFNRWESEKEWKEWIAMGEKRNSYIPARPDEYYGKRGQWISWDHFLGQLPNTNEDCKGGSGSGSGSNSQFE